MSNKGLPFDTPNAGHSYKSTINEQYGTIDIKPPYPKPPMSGFALNEHSCNVMDCIDPSHMPVTETILKEFAVVDRYFAGFPGPTEVNRLFWHATTNGGYCDNPSDDVYVEGFKMESLLHRLEQQNISAKVRLAATLPHPQPVTHSLGSDVVRLSVCLSTWRCQGHVWIEPSTPPRLLIHTRSLPSHRCTWRTM